MADQKEYLDHKANCQNDRELLKGKVDQQFLDEVRRYYAHLQVDQDDLDRLTKARDYLRAYKVSLDNQKRQLGLDSSATLIDVQIASRIAEYKQERQKLGLPEYATENQVINTKSGLELIKERKLLGLPSDAEDEIVWSEIDKRKYLEYEKAFQSSLQKVKESGLRQAEEKIAYAQSLYPQLDAKQAWFHYAQKQLNLPIKLKFENRNEKAFGQLELAADNYYIQRDLKLLGDIPGSGHNQDVKQFREKISAFFDDQISRINVNLSPSASKKELDKAYKLAMDKSGYKSLTQRFHLPTSYSYEQAKVLSAAWDKFEQDYGVRVFHVSHTHKQIYSDSKDVKAQKLLFEFDISEDSISKGIKSEMRSLRHFIINFIHAKEKSLEQKYKISFYPENDTLKINPPYSDSTKCLTRLPTISELIGLEAALKKSNPGHLRGYGQHLGTKLYFLEYDTKYAQAWVDIANPLYPIYITSSGKALRAIEDDEVAMGFYADKKEDPVSAEALFIHELAHRSQQITNWEQGSSYASEMSQLGWLIPKFVSGQLPNRQWMLQDKGHNYYYYNDHKRSWHRLNQHGNPIDSYGHPVKPGDQRGYISNNDLRPLLTKSPLTGYFKNPTEEDAEAMRLYRLGGLWRKCLLNYDRTIYGIIKDRDQDEIVLQYGLWKGGLWKGRSKYVRDPSGVLAFNTEHEQQVIRQFEQQP